MNFVQQILLAIWHWITPQVEGILNPQFKAKLEELRAKETAWEAQVKEIEAANRASEASYQTSLNYRNELNKRIADSQAIEEQLTIEENDLHKRIADRHARVAILNQDVLDRTDDDAFRGGVPKSKDN